MAFDIHTIKNYLLSWFSWGEDEVNHSYGTFSTTAWLHLIRNWKILKPKEFYNFKKCISFCKHTHIEKHWNYWWKSCLFHFWEKRLVERKLLRLNRVSYCNKRLKCSLLGCKCILINLNKKDEVKFRCRGEIRSHLIWTDGDFNLTIQIHPVLVWLVVIIREEGIASRLEKSENWI